MTDQVLQWINHNPEWAGIVVFSIAFLESLAVVGVLIPGWLLLVGIGTLIGSGFLDFYTMVMCSFLGATIGEGISYFAGYYYHTPIKNWLLSSNYKKSLTVAEDFFHKYGMVSVVLGRFFGPVRAVIPVVAGMFSMPPRRFMLANILSAMVWAPAYFFPGILLGAALKFEANDFYLILFFSSIILLSTYLVIRYNKSYFSYIVKNRSLASDEDDKKFFELLKAVMSWLILFTVLAIVISHEVSAQFALLLQEVYQVVS